MSTKMAKLIGAKTKQDLETLAKEREQILFNNFRGNLGSFKYYGTVTFRIIDEHTYLILIYVP